MMSEASFMSNEYLSIMATERMVAMGFAMPFPAISGALPWIGSYMALFFVEPMLAEGSMPMEPVSIEASSDSMSPKVFSVTMTSNCLGFLMSCMAQLSTYMWLSSTSGYSLPIFMTTFLQSSVVSRTFALSTLQSFLPRFIATSKPTLAILSISGVV